VAALEAKQSLSIVSWNIGQRGLRRTVSEVFGGSLSAMLAALDNPDVLCLQETKITRVELCRWGEELVKVAGYLPYVSFHRKAIGYCGVATYCSARCTPHAAGTARLSQTNLTVVFVRVNTVTDYCITANAACTCTTPSHHAKLVMLNCCVRQRRASVVCCAEQSPGTASLPILLTTLATTGDERTAPSFFQCSGWTRRVAVL
jgi:exonuclease III